MQRPTRVLKPIETLAVRLQVAIVRLNWTCSRVRDAVMHLYLAQLLGIVQQCLLETHS